MSENRTRKPSPWRSEFHKTSRHYQKNQTHFAAYCRGCVRAKVTEIRARETTEFDTGRISEVRAVAAIENESDVSSWINRMM